MFQISQPRSQVVLIKVCIKATILRHYTFQFTVHAVYWIHALNLTWCAFGLTAILHLNASGKYIATCAFTGQVWF